MKKFLRFMVSSLSASAIDLGLFTLFCNLFRGSFGMGYAAAATVLARIASSVYNYLINYKLVFKSRESYLQTGLRYTVVAVIKMLLSAALVTGFLYLFQGIKEIRIKIPVDVVLFFVNYLVQRKFVYGAESKETNPRETNPRETNTQETNLQKTEI